MRVGMRACQARAHCPDLLLRPLDSRAERGRAAGLSGATGARSCPCRRTAGAPGPPAQRDHVSVTTCRNSTAELAAARDAGGGSPACAGVGFKQVHRACRRACGCGRGPCAWWARPRRRTFSHRCPWRCCRCPRPALGSNCTGWASARLAACGAAHHRHLAALRAGGQAGAALGAGQGQSPRLRGCARPARAGDAGDRAAQRPTGAPAPAELMAAARAAAGAGRVACRRAAAACGAALCGRGHVDAGHYLHHPPWGSRGVCRRRWRSSCRRSSRWSEVERVEADVLEVGELVGGQLSLFAGGLEGEMGDALNPPLAELAHRWTGRHGRLSGGRTVMCADPVPERADCLQPV